MYHTIAKYHNTITNYTHKVITKHLQVDTRRVANHFIAPMDTMTIASGRSPSGHTNDHTKDRKPLYHTLPSALSYALCNTCMCPTTIIPAVSITDNELPSRWIALPYRHGTH